MITEAVDPPSSSKRAAAGLAAGREVSAGAVQLEKDATVLLLKRLAQLKRELQGVIAAAAGDGDSFRGFTASSLIQSIDGLITQATAELAGEAGRVYQNALSIGAAKVDEPINAARISLTTAPQLDRTLVRHAFDTNAELLTQAMQQFRNQVVQGVRRAAVAGASGFDQLRALAGSIDKQGFDNAAFKAERIMRTELGRVLNGSTFDRLVSLASTLPFLRKGWRAAKDGRTRQGHREAAVTYARGKGIPIAEPFRINVYQEFPGKPVGKLLGVASLRYPIDPLTTPGGRIAAGATIMCRCNAFVDFDTAELERFATGGRATPPKPKPGATTPGFAEPPIKGIKPATPIAPPKPKPIERTAAETIAEIKRIKATRDLTHEHLAKAYKDTSDAMYDAIVKRDRLVDRALHDDPINVAARAEVDRLRAIHVKASEALVANTEANHAKLRELFHLAEDQRTTLKYSIADDAEFHRGFSKKYNRNGSLKSQEFLDVDLMRARIAKTIAEVERMVSKDLTFGNVIVDNARDQQTGEIPLSPRAYAVEAASMGTGRPGRRGNSINLSPAEDARTIAHELGHLLEFNNANVRESAIAFLERRTRGEELQLLSELRPGHGYRPDERAKPDKFKNPYTGKSYGAARWTEVVSMGLEYMFDDPAKFADDDPDYFEFIFDLLRGRPNANKGKK